MMHGRCKEDDVTFAFLSFEMQNENKRATDLIVNVDVNV